MKKIIATVLLAGFMSSALAQVASDAAKIEWTNATQMTDGTPIPATGPTALKQTTVQRSVTATCATGAFLPVAEEVNVPATSSSALFENLRPAGKHCFRIRHVLENGTMSDFSAVVSKMITLPVPLKPKPPTVTIQ